jgi:Fe-S-cluster-containing hydrogenase component 2
MSKDVYQRLAARLDALPNGFPPTESGVELRLLEKMFAGEEADLASVMRLRFETAEEIATRAGWNEKEAYRTLKGMVRHGLIRVRKGEHSLLFSLMPFVVGIYEEQLPRMDEEMALLFEAYFQESRGGGITQKAPAVHRVIPVEESLDFELEIFPYERATELIQNARSWAVRDCICRVQQRLIGKGCEHPVEACLVFAPVEGVFDHSKVDRAITQEEALEILRKAEQAGLVHTAGNFQGPHSYICNCCTCSCGILRGVAEFGIGTAVAKSDFLAGVEPDLCVGCEECLERCQFGALGMEGEICIVDEDQCVGCGLCISACAAGALTLQRRLEAERAHPPKDIREWGELRARERGISLEDVL